MMKHDAMGAARRLGEGFAEVVWPTRCAVCGLPDVLLCPRCLHELPRIDARDACVRCGAPHGWIACTECEPLYPDDDELDEKAVAGPVFPFEQARCVCSYEGGASSVVRAYKDGGERRLARPIAVAMASSVDPVWRSWADAIVFIPASPQALRRRGFDHMQLVAEELSCATGIPVVDLLGRSDARDQRALSRELRAENARESFSLSPGRENPGNVLLVDDVFTTGATLSAATQTLLTGCVSAVRALTFARVW